MYVELTFTSLAGVAVAGGIRSLAGVAVVCIALQVKSFGLGLESNGNLL